MIQNETFLERLLAELLDNLHDDTWGQSWVAGNEENWRYYSGKEPAWYGIPTSGWSD